MLGLQMFSNTRSNLTVRVFRQAIAAEHDVEVSNRDRLTYGTLQADTPRFPSGVAVDTQQYETVPKNAAMNAGAIVEGSGGLNE